MAESENANTIIRNRTQLKPLVGKRFSFMGYLCSFNKNKYGDVENYPYVALLIDIFSFQYKVNLEHVHVQLTEADYEAIKNRNNLFLVFTGTVFTYEARVKRIFKNKYNQTEYRVLREPRFGFEDVTIEHVNMNEKLDQLNAEFSSILTTYETYAVGQIVTELTKVGIHPVSKKIIMTRLTEEKSVLKRDKMLRRLQMKLTYEKVVQQDVPELFYVRPALLNATDFDNVIEESKQKQHNLKIDSELRIL